MTSIQMFMFLKTGLVFKKLLKNDGKIFGCLNGEAMRMHTRML